VFPGGETSEGLVDMSGNVYDWTSTAYRKYRYDAGDGREDPANADARRVLRGGSWNNNQHNARAAYRNRNNPNNRNNNIGFRVVRVPRLRPPSRARMRLPRPLRAAAVYERCAASSNARRPRFPGRGEGIEMAQGSPVRAVGDDRRAHTQTRARPGRAPAVPAE